MHYRNKKKVRLAVAIGCSLMAAHASWGAYTEISVSAVNGTTMSSAAWNGGPSAIASSGWAGSWTATIKNPQPPGYYVPPSPYYAGYTFTAFCTDIGNVMPGGTYDYEALAFSSASLMSPEGIPPDPNWADGLSGQRAAWIYNTYVGSVNSADTRAAMCIAVWEALYEGKRADGTYAFDVSKRGTGTDTSGRTFVATGSSTVQGIANGWLNQGVTAGFAGYDYTWFAERDLTGYGDVQSLVGPWAPIPEPTTCLAGLLLLLPFGVSTLRTLRKNRAV